MGARQTGFAMGWDFSTDPAYEEQLEWARRFVREEIEPLDVAFAGHVVYDKSHHVHAEVVAPQAML